MTAENEKKTKEREGKPSQHNRERHFRMTRKE